MEYCVKRLTYRDVQLLKNVLGVFAQAFGEPETYQGAVPGDRYLIKLLKERCFIALAALFGDIVVGGLAAYELKKFEQERSEIYIYDLAVAHSHRRKGVAKSLIIELKEVAREREAWVIFMQADRGDAPAINLYESLGKREEVYNFDISVR